MTRLAGSKILAEDFQLPDVVTAYGDGNNTITSTTFADLPTVTCIAAITNPHPTAALIVLVSYGAWLSVTASSCRICPRVSGSVTMAAGVGAGGPSSWGEIAYTTLIGNPQQCQASSTYSLPVSGSAATFTMQSHRGSATGTQNCNYPVLRIIPLHYTL